MREREKRESQRERAEETLLSTRENVFKTKRFKEKKNETSTLTTGNNTAEYCTFDQLSTVKIEFWGR